MRNLITLLLFILPASLVAAPTVDEIVHRSNMTTYYQGEDGRAQVKMIITDSQGRERQRQLTILRIDAAKSDAIEGDAYLGGQKFYIYFHRPADVNKMAFLVWKHLDQDDDRWLYLPALDLVKRIAASDKRTSFVGSDFFYEDVSGRRLDEDRHELIETTKSYYVIKNSPKDADAVEFSYYKAFIHKQTFIPVQVEYFDKAGNKYRIAKALGVKNIQGYPTVTKASVENLKTGSKTVMEYSKVEYDIGLDDALFTERYLRKAPRRQLR
ncbi:MAG: outer membrane lipoprotein-sorting protein [Candidatus Polarisedimenticolaceae bacterium]|nr:outer membrane lipoprotein-sorting protein [Candidatus Polarisedimenticolaceae bacterium]